MEPKKGVQLLIPDSVAEAIRLPQGHLQEQLLRELAVTLYQQGLLSFGKARELAGESKHAFAHLLGVGGVDRHYGYEELDDDLRYARGE